MLYCRLNQLLKAIVLIPFLWLACTFCTEGVTTNDCQTKETTIELSFEVNPFSLFILLN